MKIGRNNKSLQKFIDEFKKTSWNEMAYWLDCRPMFEVIYSKKMSDFFILVLLKFK